MMATTQATVTERLREGLSRLPVRPRPEAAAVTRVPGRVSAGERPGPWAPARARARVRRSRVSTPQGDTKARARRPPGPAEQPGRAANRQAAWKLSAAFRLLHFLHINFMFADDILCIFLLEDGIRGGIAYHPSSVQCEVSFH